MNGGTNGGTNEDADGDAKSYLKAYNIKPLGSIVPADLINAWMQNVSTQVDPNIPHMCFRCESDWGGCLYVITTKNILPHNIQFLSQLRFCMGCIQEVSKGGFLHIPKCTSLWSFVQYLNLCHNDLRITACARMRCGWHPVTFVVAPKVTSDYPAYDGSRISSRRFYLCMKHALIDRYNGLFINASTRVCDARISYSDFWWNDRGESAFSYQTECTHSQYSTLFDIMMGIRNDDMSRLRLLNRWIIKMIVVRTYGRTGCVRYECKIFGSECRCREWLE